MKKNVASQVIGAQMITAADGTAFTSTVSCLVTGDGGTQGAGGGSVTHEGNGFHSYAPTQAETNYDHIAFTFTGTGAIPATIQVYTTFPQTGDNYARLGAPAGASVSADVAAIKVDTAATLLDTGTDGVVVASGSKTGYSLASTGLDAIVSTATGMVEVAKAVWDRVLNAANHNIGSSAGKRLRLVDAAFEVHSGTTQSPFSSTTIVLTDGSASDNIYNGDRVIITEGTGIGEHGIITAYNGTTKVATMSKAWVVTPDATSVFGVVPADVDIEAWNSVPVTGDGDWLELQTDVDAILVDTDVIGATGAGLTSLATQASVNTIDDFLDTEIAAIKAKTDSLTFTVAGQVDANVQLVNDVAITGDGSTTPFNVV